jgi:hypothetical protein
VRSKGLIVVRGAAHDYFQSKNIRFQGADECFRRKIIRFQSAHDYFQPILDQEHFISDQE